MRSVTPNAMFKSIIYLEGGSFSQIQRVYHGIGQDCARCTCNGAAPRGEAHWF